MDEIQGLVLYSIDYKEKSKIIYLYTPYGLDSVKANQSKDISKGLLGFTTTLNEVSYIKSNAKLPTLIEYNLLHSNFNLTNSLDNMKVVSNILEVLRNIPKENDHKRTYDFVINIIHNLDTNPALKVLAVFLIKMLYVFGVAPNLKSCMECGSSDVHFFSLIEGGAYCRKCHCNENEEKLKIWKEYYYEKKEIKEYTNVDFSLLLEDIYIYYNYHVHIKLK